MSPTSSRRPPLTPEELEIILYAYWDNAIPTHPNRISNNRLSQILAGHFSTSQQTIHKIWSFRIQRYLHVSTALKQFYLYNPRRTLNVLLGRTHHQQ